MNPYTFGTTKADIRLVEAIHESSDRKHNARLASKFLSKFNLHMNNLLELSNETTYHTCVQALHDRTVTNIHYSSMDEKVKEFVLSSLKASMNRYRNAYWPATVAINYEPVYA